MEIISKDLTSVVHSGVKPEPITGAVMTPIFQTSTFAQESPGQHKGFDYSRADNPTRACLETSLAALEGARFALAFSSGLAAVQAVLQTLTPPCEVVVCDDVYGGTGRLFRKLFAKYSFIFRFVDFSLNWKEVITTKTKLVWIESPTNPLLKILDIEEIVAHSHQKGALVVVDNTFASPIFQKPLKMGADCVVHSTTKYIGGHSDLIGGAVMLSDPKLFEELKFVQFAAGAVPSPIESFLLLRSIKTLGLRMKQHHANAMIVAEFLERSSKVEKVIYPGLKSHPQHALASKQMSGFSGVVSFYLKGSYQTVLSFLSGLKLFVLAESLGGVESLINHPEKMTHASVPEDDRRRLGITSTLLRLSVGIEDPIDLVDDLSAALDTL